MKLSSTYALPRRIALALCLSPLLAAAPSASENPGEDPAYSNGGYVADSAPSAAAPEAATPLPRRRARSVDLDQPITEIRLQHIEKEVDQAIDTQYDRAQSEAVESLDEMVDIADLPGAPPESFVMLETAVEAGTAARLAWQPGESFAGVAVPTPVLVVNGAKSGPVLCLTAAVHGDELNGIEIVRRVLYDLDPVQLKGTVVGVPIVNLLGFKRSSRYLPDRRDLNRHFPGNPTGSSASRIAHSFFTEIVSHCDVLVDLHTGSFYRANLPQLRADLRRPEVVHVAESFAFTAIVHSPGATGSLRRAATESGIPTVTLEAGEPMRLQAEEVEHGVKGIYALIDQLGMYRKLRVWGNPAPVHYQSRWVRADAGGILFGKVKLGQRVKPGDLLGTVTDPITNLRADILSPYDGRIIGMAVDQVVLPGFAAFHVGIQTTAEDLYEPRVMQPAPSEPLPDSNDYDPDARDNLEDS
jgi:predicted deacylase